MSAVFFIAPGGFAAMALATVSAFGQGMQIPKPSSGPMPHPVAGKQLFATACVQCHGADLRGTKEGPSLVHRIYEPSHHRLT